MTPQWTAYEKALEKLRLLQDECERPENRYYCPCISVAEGIESAEYIAESYAKFAAYLYLDGPDKPPRPIDPENVTPNEMFFRMLDYDNYTPENVREILTANAMKKETITDGYVRWSPSSRPRVSSDLNQFTKRITREIQKLEGRRDGGYGSMATPCDTCQVTTPETKYPQTGILGVTSYLCEMARAQTPEEIEISNANIDPDSREKENLWALKPADAPPP